MPKSKKIKILPTRFIGIDFGETGIAYSVLEISDKQADQIKADKDKKLGDHLKVVTILETGFINVTEIEKIINSSSRDKNATKGTFSIGVSKNKRRSEQAINKISNQIHVLALKYKAKIIYEYKIGIKNQTINMIFRKVKSLDIIDSKETREEAKARAGKWGTEYYPAGIHVTDKFSSQYSLYSRDIVEKDDIVHDYFYRYSIVSKHKDTSGKEILYISVDLDTKKIFIYARPDELEKSILGKDLFRLYKNSLRPYFKEMPVEHLEILKDQDKKLYETYVGFDRSTKVIYKDPFTEEPFFMDADIQASKFIAITGILREIERYHTDKFLEYDLFWEELKKTLKTLKMWFLVF